MAFFRIVLCHAKSTERRGKSIKKHSIEYIKLLFDKFNEKEGGIYLPDLSRLEKSSMNNLIYRLSNYNINIASQECTMYMGGKSISYLELFCIIWSEQRRPKLCLLLGVE